MPDDSERKIGSLSSELRAIGRTRDRLEDDLKAKLRAIQAAQHAYDQALVALTQTRDEWRTKAQELHLELGKETR